MEQRNVKGSNAVLMKNACKVNVEEITISKIGNKAKRVQKQFQRPRINKNSKCCNKPFKEQRRCSRRDRKGNRIHGCY